MVASDRDRFNIAAVPSGFRIRRNAKSECFQTPLIRHGLFLTKLTCPEASFEPKVVRNQRKTNWLSSATAAEKLREQVGWYALSVSQP
jgi:hypothetical protein